MSDMRKLLESMTKFVGEPAQRPGDQVRGTEQAKKKKSGDHPFQGRLVGEDNIFKELEKQLVEGDVERRLREEFEQFNEFASNGGGSDGGNYFRELASAWYNGTFDTGSLQKGIKSQEDVERLLNRGIVCPDGKTRKLHIDYNSDFDGVEIYSDDYYEYGDHDDTIDSRTGQKWGPYDFMAFSDEDLSEGLNEFAADDGNSGGEDDVLRNYARMWWAGDEATQMQIERVLAQMGWEIGEDEGGYDNGGVFVVRAGDENGNSYQSWAAEELEGLGEGIFGFMAKQPAKNKTEPADDFSAKLLDRRQKQQTQAPKEKVYRGPEEYRRAKEQGVAENEGDPEGLPHLTKELLTHIVDQVGKEGAHAIVKSLTWGDGAAKELLHLIVNDLEDDIHQGIETQPVDEKSMSQSQFRTMAAVAHNPEFAKKVGIKPSVAKEFHKADKKQNYKKLPKKITELGANNPPQQNSAVTGTATAAQQPAAPGQTPTLSPADAAGLKQGLQRLKTSVPGLDITKAVTAMTKADTGVPLTPGDKNVTSAIAPELANVMKNPQMASSLKMMIDKANQQEKAAAAKPPGTV